MLSLPNLKRFLLWNICFPQCTFFLFFLLFGYIFCLLCALFVISANTQADTHAPHSFGGVSVYACPPVFMHSGFRAYFCFAYLPFLCVGLFFLLWRISSLCFAAPEP